MPQEPKERNPVRASRLDLVEKLLQPEILPSARDVALGVSLRAPIVVELDPTSFCDLACPDCISKDLLSTSRFSKDRLFSLVDEIAAAGVSAVILIGGGEPLAHPSTFEAVTRLAGHGVQVGLTTNGTLLHRNMKAIAHNTSWTRVSVDAATAETFHSIRPSSSGSNLFQRVVSNMRELATTKSGQLGFSFVVTPPRAPGCPANMHEIEAAASLAKDIGCDYFELKPLYDSQHFLTHLTHSDRLRLTEQLDQVHQLADSHFEVIAPRTLAEAIADRSEELKEYSSCAVAQMRTLITSSGAYICPYHRGNSNARYGDPVSETFQGLWAGEARREAIRNIDPRRDCRFHCIRHPSNEMIGKLGHNREQLYGAVSDKNLPLTFDPFI